jgi:hypothetical protein
MPPGRTSWLRRSVGLALARRALWRSLAARGSDPEAGLARVIADGGMDLAGGSAGDFRGRSRDVPRGFQLASAADPPERRRLP